MNELGKEVAIDIGGGRGEYFAWRAREEPDKTFVVLEPRLLRIKRKPPNLHFIRWRSDKNSSVPLSEGSVDEVNINFLFGEICWGEGEKDTGQTIEEARIRYENLLEEVKRVFKSGALLTIVDVKENIGYIMDLLKAKGLTIKSEPTKLTDEKMSQWSQVFFECFRRKGRREEDSFSLPMVIKASWQKT